MFISISLLRFTFIIHAKFNCMLCLGILFDGYIYFTIIPSTGIITTQSCLKFSIYIQISRTIFCRIA